MSDLAIGPELVGTKVSSPTRPEWGVGTVLRVQTARENGKTVSRVSVQFPVVGHKLLISPPARLCPPVVEPERQQHGWLDVLARSTLDDRLRALPESVTDVLGGPLERLRATLPLYAIRDDAGSLLKWARTQTGVGDPLAHWSRDELTAAFSDFRISRDAHFKNIAASVQKQGRMDELRSLLNEQPEDIRAAVHEAMQRVI